MRCLFIFWFINLNLTYQITISVLSSYRTIYTEDDNVTLICIIISTWSILYLNPDKCVSKYIRILQSDRAFARLRIYELSFEHGVNSRSDRKIKTMLVIFKIFTLRCSGDRPPPPPTSHWPYPRKPCWEIRLTIYLCADRTAGRPRTPPLPCSVK